MLHVERPDGCCVDLYYCWRCLHQIGKEGDEVGELYLAGRERREPVQTADIMVVSLTHHE